MSITLRCRVDCPRCGLWVVFRWESNWGPSPQRAGCISCGYVQPLTWAGGLPLQMPLPVVAS